MNNVDICPTILAADVRTYGVQMDQVASFAMRIHIDVCDGQFAPTLTVPLDEVWWPGGLRADLHVMYQRPLDHLKALIALQPALIIVHAEADGDFREFAAAVHRHGIEAGVALLPQTPVETLRAALKFIDHVLVFSGDLGHFGGHADLKLLDKVRQLKEEKPAVEIGWDGGVNESNAPQLADGRVEVLNAGGFLHGAQDPRQAYDKLQASINGEPAHV